MLTNGEIIQVGPNAGEIRKYRLIMQDGEDSWVQAMNGNYKGERLTFTTSNLREINENDPC